MNEYVMRARERFMAMKARPATYARYKEAFLAEVTGIAAVLDPEFDVPAFSKKHCRTDPKDSEIDDKWCRAVINDVLRLPIFNEEPELGCCGDCYNSHGHCVEHGNCECHTKHGRKVT